MRATDSGRPHETPSFRSARWTFQTSGLVELPRGIYVAATIRGRDGDPLPYYRRIARERAGIAARPAHRAPDAFRTGEVVTLDGRLAKEHTAARAAGEEVVGGHSLDPDI